MLITSGGIVLVVIIYIIFFMASGNQSFGTDNKNYQGLRGQAFQKPAGLETAARKLKYYKQQIKSREIKN